MSLGSKFEVESGVWVQVNMEKEHQIEREDSGETECGGEAEKHVEEEGRKKRRKKGGRRVRERQKHERGW